MNMNFYVTYSLNMLIKRKNDFFRSMDIKTKLNFFSNNNSKFQPRTWKSVLFNKNCSVLFCSM